VELDNRWVVPYNPYLAAKYHWHINVEICSTVVSVKYLYKYVYKGHDRATVSIGTDSNIDEIEKYLSGRYISASEACWTILDYPMQDKSHSIVRLCVHFPDSNYVIFHPTEDPARVLERSRSTMLTRFFEMCAADPQAAELLYHELPQHYVWQTTTRSWKRRHRCGDKAIGRMVSCSPIDVERYHLRLLLCYRRGPESFEDLRTVNDVLYPTFKDTALT
jgi:hypothetical protein